MFIHLQVPSQKYIENIYKVKLTESEYIELCEHLEHYYDDTIESEIEFWLDTPTGKEGDNDAA